MNEKKSFIIALDKGLFFYGGDFSWESEALFPSMRSLCTASICRRSWQGELWEWKKVMLWIWKYGHTSCFSLPFAEIFLDAKELAADTDRRMLFYSLCRNMPKRKKTAFCIYSLGRDIRTLRFRQTVRMRFAPLCAWIFLNMRIFWITDLIKTHICARRFRGWTFRFWIKNFMKKGRIAGISFFYLFCFDD